SFCNIIWPLFLLGNLFLAGESHSNGRSWIDRFNKAAFIQAVVEKNRSLFCLYEQPRSFGQQVVSMCHISLEQGAFQGSCVHVCVEMIARQIRKVINIRLS